MKRILSLMLALFMCLSTVHVLAESTNPYEVDESLVGEFTWWSFFDQIPFLAEQFNLKYPNVKINYEIYGGDEYQTKLLNTLPSGQGVPDIFDLEEGYVYKFIDSPLLADLESLGLSDVNSEYYDWAIAMGRDSSGTLKGICDNVSPVAFWYIRDAMEKWLGTSDDAEISGILNSWSAIKEKAREIKEASDGAVYLWPNLGEMVKVSAFSLIPFVRDGEFAVRDGWMNLVDTMREFHDAGLVANLGSWSGEWATAWNDGSLLIRTMPSWDFFTDWSKNEGNVGVAAPFQNSYEGGTYRAIYANSPNKEVCIKFLEFLTTHEYQLQNLAVNNQMPANKNIVNLLGEDYSNERFGGQNIIKTYDAISRNIPDIIPDQYTRGIQNMFSKHAQQGVRDGLNNEQIFENFLKEVKDTYPELKGL